jgi:hypothetical protein
MSTVLGACSGVDFDFRSGLVLMVASEKILDAGCCIKKWQP